MIPVILTSGFSRSEGVPVQDEATNRYDRLVLKGVTLSDSDFDIENDVFYYLKNSLSLDGITSNYDCIDVMRIGCGTEIATRENWIKDLHHATITNNYGGSHIAYVGYRGNGTNFSVNTNTNLSTTTKASQNSATLLILSLENRSGDNNHAVSALNAGGSSGTFMHIKRNAAAGHDFNGTINGANSGASSGKTVISSRAWFGVQRKVSTGAECNINGYVSSVNVGTSASPLNLNITEFAASLNGTISSWENNSHGVFIVGNGDLDINKVIEIITKYYFIPHGIAESVISNRFVMFGDSMTGNSDISVDASDLSEIARRTQTGLGDTWTSSQNGQNNRQLITDTTNVPSLINLPTNQVYTGSNTAFTKDVVNLFIGTNDFALSTAISVATFKTNLDNVINNFLAEDKIVIITGIVARGSSPAAGFETKRTQLKDLMLIDYAVSTGITNVTQNSAGTVFYINLSADSRFSNPLDLTYFRADEVHLTTVADDIIADEYLVPICQL